MKLTSLFVGCAALCCPALGETFALDSFAISDPFIWRDDAAKVYRMYELTVAGSNSVAGVAMRTSSDLQNWSAPQQVMEVPASEKCQAVWAPEMHEWRGKYYMFGTLSTFRGAFPELSLMSDKPGWTTPTWAGRPRRGTYVYRADSPSGPFMPWSKTSIPPSNWSTLDGTLWVEDGVPYMVFCHEWTQVHDGRMCAVEMTDDLSAAVGEPFELFRASSACGVDASDDHYTTDGAWLFKTADNRLMMTWSTYMQKKYVVCLYESQSGKLKGPWRHVANVLGGDSGHGMIFKTFAGEEMLVYHSPNSPSHAKRAHIIPFAQLMRTAESAPLLHWDFEDGSAQGWARVRGAESKLISERTHCYKSNSGTRLHKQGRYFLTTMESKAGAEKPFLEMLIESPVFTCAGGEIEMLVTGGDWKSCVQLFDVTDGKERFVCRSGRYGWQHFQTEKFDVTKLAGHKLVLRIVDETDWNNGGYVALDDVRALGKIDEAATAARRTALAAKFAADDAKEVSEAVREKFVRNNPLVNSSLILYVARPQYPNDHHNTATIFQCGEVNAKSYDGLHGTLKVLDAKTDRCKVLFDPGAEGMVRDVELASDGERIVFAMRRNAADSYHIFTARLANPNSFDSIELVDLKQLTRNRDVNDIDPVFLPDGGIAFSSTREPKYCMCNRHIMCNLYRMDIDGANILQIGRSTLFEGHSSLLADGRILYDRWEYVDRNFGDAQGLWTCNPDGTAHAIYWGNNTTSPGGVIDARELSEGKVIATLSSCHDRPRGALAIIDRSLGVDGKDPVVRTWPANFRDRIHTDKEDYDSPNGIVRKYEDPYPLDAEHFLCSHRPPVSSLTCEDAIYYLDLEGNEVLVHAEAENGCYDPMPIRPRQQAKVIAARRNYESIHAPGTFYLQNVYEGTHMQGVTNGTIKFLRVVESPEKRNWSQQGWGGQGEQAPGMNWHNFENKRVLGIVPVAADGSALFTVPANTFVFFQALDAQGMMVQSMRSGTYVQPGEIYGCVGCHENRVAAAPAVRKAAKPHGRVTELPNVQPKLYSFQRDVQPIFTKNCVRCHDFENCATSAVAKAASAKLNLAGDRDLVFCASYMDLWSREYVKCVGAGPAEIQSAHSWGSSVSPLVAKLFTAPHSTRLTEEERMRIIEWVDLNAPYYPYYECAYSENKAGRSPLTPAEVYELEKLSGVKVPWDFRSKPRAWVSFARPEESPMLQGLRATNSVAFARGVAIVTEGAKRLQAKPRADMEGFVPNATDQAREERYQRRAKDAERFNNAIRDGKKVYDLESDKNAAAQP